MGVRIRGCTAWSIGGRGKTWRYECPKVLAKYIGGKGKQWRHKCPKVLAEYKKKR